jgi:hypothetical protein
VIWLGKQMKPILRALFWSIAFEAFLVALSFGGRIGLPFLTYLALTFHFPALYVLDFWPAAGATLIAPILIQWLIWFGAFSMLFLMRYRHHRRHSA